MEMSLYVLPPSLRPGVSGVILLGKELGALPMADSPIPLLREGLLLATEVGKEISL